MPRGRSRRCAAAPCARFRPLSARDNASIFETRATLCNDLRRRLLCVCFFCLNLA
jgi:hypothetical protein